MCKNIFRRKGITSLISHYAWKLRRHAFLKDKSIYLAIKLSSSEKLTKDEFALIEIPTDVLPRFIELPSENEKKFIILLEDIIRFSLEDVFSIFDFDTFEAWTIKMTRDAELDVDNDLTQSFLEKIVEGGFRPKDGSTRTFCIRQQ
ncbi:MAG: polyphosphate kinase 1, partial [Bacteroidetes bacterium]|nr:polyphosphate kinase 1 [Bacteroidota bacterium]